MVRLYGWLAAVLVVGVTVLWLAGRPGFWNMELPQLPQLPAPAAKPWYRELQYSARTALKSRLSDPASAEVRFVGTFGPVDRSKTNLAAVCGEVNSRNGYGGMTGFIRFVVPFREEGGKAYSLPDMIVLAEGDRGTRAVFNTMWDAFCQSGWVLEDLRGR